MFGARFTDGAGDTVTTMTVQGPVERIEVLVEGTVETADTAGVLRDHREIISPRVYLQSTHGDRAEPGARRAAGRGARGRRRRPTSSARAHRLAEAVAEAIAYAPGRHRTPTPPPPRRWSRARASARTTRTR